MTHSSSDLNYNYHPIIYSILFYFSILISSLLISSISISFSYSIFTFLTITTQSQLAFLSHSISLPSHSHTQHHNKSHLTSPTPVEISTSYPIHSFFSHKPQFLTPLKFLIFNNNS